LDKPYQTAYIAGGFFFVRSEFLIDVPFDPYLPWIFMGEEIALSLRAWTHGWDIVYGDEE
jgi:GT2 family glycosyltransferase